LPFVVDYADFAGANAVIGADKALVDAALRGLSQFEIMKL